tara:strand:+ start:450 stop:881 length:432 start_codon:yes stop_codon:yes gene_type:complete
VNYLDAIYQNYQDEFENPAAKGSLEGKTITRVRYQTDEERERHGWRCASLVLVLDDETQVFIAADPELNGPGAVLVIKDRDDVYGPTMKPATRKFKTDDGYVFWYDAAQKVWTDGDLVSDVGEHGRPVDSNGDPLDGYFIDEV